MRQISKSEILRMIEEGVTKNKKSPNYTPECGTFHEKLNMTQGTVKRLFSENLDLQRAYNRKHKPAGKANDFTLVDDLVGQPEVDSFAQLEVEEQIEEQEQALNWE